MTSLTTPVTATFASTDPNPSFDRDNPDPSFDRDNPSPWTDITKIHIKFSKDSCLPSLHTDLNKRFGQTFTDLDNLFDDGPGRTAVKRDIAKLLKDAIITHIAPGTRTPSVA